MKSKRRKTAPRKVYKSKGTLSRRKTRGAKKATHSGIADMGGFFKW